MSLWSEAEKFTSRPIIFQFTSSTWQVLNRTTTFIEIGICKVGSLQLWKRYLGPFAQIVGIDIDPTCKVVEEDQIAVRIGDESDLNFLQKIIDEFGSPDVVLDDGSHMMSDMRASFEFLYPHISKNGVYMIEDLHTAYWVEYGGGIGRVGSFIEQAKGLIDESNVDHSRGAVPISEFSRTTMSMRFYDSVVAFERGRHLKKHAPIIGRDM